jgi:hypothetical protein
MMNCGRTSKDIMLANIRMRPSMATVKLTSLKK